LGVAEEGNLKLYFMAKSIGIQFFGLNTFLDVIEIPKPQKPCWLYRHFKTKTKVITLTNHRRHRKSIEPIKLVVKSMS